MSLKKVLFVKKLKNLKFEILNNNYFIVSSSVHPFFKNWGDDINTVLVEFINPDKKVIQRNYSFNFKHKTDYLCIGSIISWMTTPNSVIWGSGIQFPDDEIMYKGKIIKPKKVLAVRGPLTRKYLLDKGIDCPEIFGDPALLFPRYYQPKKEKQYKCGIIPHFKDKDSERVKELRKNPDIHFIDVQRFDDWRYFIDEINSCEMILSSSLHGIILSDAYDVPNAWVEFGKINLKRFTFQDYFLSVQKDIMEPNLIEEKTSFDEIMTWKNQWKKPEINLEKLMEVCPFKS